MCVSACVRGYVCVRAWVGVCVYVCVRVCASVSLSVCLSVSALPPHVEQGTLYKSVAVTAIANEQVCVKDMSYGQGTGEIVFRRVCLALDFH